MGLAQQAATERQERLRRLGAIPGPIAIQGQIPMPTPSPPLNPHAYGPPVPWGYKTAYIPTSRAILKIVAMVWEKSEADITCERRDLAYVLPRLAAFYLARKLTRESSTRIGRIFNRDHSTVLSDVRRAEKLITRDDAYARKVRAAEDIIRDRFHIIRDIFHMRDQNGGQ